MMTSAISRLRQLPWTLSACLGLVVGALAVLDPALSFRIDLSGLGGRLLAAFPYLVAAGSTLFICFALLGWIGWDRWGGDQVLLLLLVVSVYPGLPFVGTVSLLAVYWVTLARAASGERWEIVGTPTYVFLLFYVGAIVFSIVPSELIVWVGSIAKKLILIAFFFFLVTTVRTRAQVQRCLAYYFMAGAASALFGLAQALTFYKAGVILLPHDVVEWWRSPLGLLPRATSFFGNPNWFGAAMAGVGVYMLWLGACGGAYYGRIKRGLLILGAIFAFLASFFSASRASWLGIIVALVLMPVVRRPWITLHYLLGLSILTAGGYLFGVIEPVLAKVEGLRPAAVGFRVYVAELAWEAVRESPWLGVGMRGLDLFNNPFRLPAHNMILDVATEMGVAAAVGTILWMLSLIIRAIRGLHAASQRPEVVFLQGAFLSFIAMLVYDQFDVFFVLKTYWFHLGILEAAILICAGKGLPKTARPIFGR